MDGGGPGCGFDLVVRHLPAHAVGDVLADGTREQEGLLLDDADLLAQEVARIVLQLDAVQGQAAAGIVVEAGQQVDQRRLARAGGTQQGHDLAGLAAEADILQHRAVRHRTGKADIFEGESRRRTQSGGA